MCAAARNQKRFQKSDQISAARAAKERRAARAAKRKRQHTKSTSSPVSQSRAKSSAEGSVEVSTEGPPENSSESPSRITSDNSSEGPPETHAEPHSQKYQTHTAMQEDTAADNEDAAADNEDAAADDEDPAADNENSDAIIKSNGFVIDSMQRLMEKNLRSLGEDAAQGKVMFFYACYRGQLLDKSLGDVGRPPRWNLLPDDKKLPPNTLVLPDDQVQLDKNAAKRLQEICEVAAKGAHDRTLRVEILEELADVLRAVLKPHVESYLSGTLKLIDSGEIKVNVLPSKKLEYVTLLFEMFLARVENNKLSSGVAFEMARVLNSVLKSATGEWYISPLTRDVLCDQTARVQLGGFWSAVLPATL